MANCENKKDNGVKYSKYESFTSKCYENDYKLHVGLINKYILEEDVNNIGIIGPHSSGKSSIVKSFLKGYDEKSLIISLSKFTKKDDPGESDLELDKEILIGLLLSKQTNWFDNNRKTIISTLLSIWFILTVFSIKSTFWPTEIFSISNYISIIIITSTVLLSAFLLFLLFKLSVFKIETIAIKDIFEIKSKNQTSLIDEYKDELINKLYKRKLKLIIFEDLDRYSNSNMILSQLKEINTILNNKNKKGRDKVTFIYCISENVFSNPTDKTKFLDAIITTSFVSNIEKIKYEINGLSAELNERWPYILISFIKDMRFMNSIINDYYYFNDMGIAEEDKNKVLAMAVYKNFFPNDFNNLYLEKSILNKIFKKYEEDKFDPTKSDNASFDKLWKEHTLPLLKTGLEQRKENNAKSKETEFNELLYELLKNGYLDNNYYNIIYKQDDYYLSSNDREFVSNIIDAGKMMFDHKLSNLSAIYHNLNKSDFHKKSTVNYYFIKHLYNEDKVDKLDKIALIISDGLIKDILDHKLIKEEDVNLFSDLFVKCNKVFECIFENMTPISVLIFNKIFLNIENDKLIKSDLNNVTKILNHPDVLLSLENANVDKVITRINSFLIKLTKINGYSKLINKIYENNLFEINEHNINNYIKEKCNNDNKNQLTNLMKSPEIKKYIGSFFDLYISNVWLKEKRKENDEAIAYILKNYKKNCEIILENKEDKIENLAPLKFSSGILNEIVKQNTYDFTVDNFNFLHENGIGIIYSNIDDIIGNKINLNKIVLGELINNSNISTDKLESYITDENYEYLLETITNEAVFIKIFKKRSLYKIKDSIVKHIISENLVGVYNELITNYYNKVDFRKPENILEESFQLLLEKTMKTGTIGLIEEYVKTKPLFFNYYNFENEGVNKKIVSTIKNNPEDITIDFAINAYNNLNNVIILRSVINSSKTKKDEFINKLSSVNHPYCKFEKKKKIFKTSEFKEIKLLHFLQKEQIVKRRKVTNKQEYKVQLIKK